MIKTLRLLILPIFMLMSLSLPLLAQDTKGNPEDIILNAFNAGIEILKSPEYAGKNTVNKRRRAIWAHLQPHIDLEEMAKRALGPTWKDLNSSEREEFIAVFTDILRHFYLGKIDTYQGEEIHYVRKLEKGNRCKVQTQLITKSDDKYTVDFSMMYKNQKWKAYDLTVEGVSIIGNYRSQFKSILSKKSFGELMEQLKEKRKETLIEGLDNEEK